MKIDKNKVVSIHYTLRNNEGKVLDSSEGRDPLNYIQGTGQLIPGMEEALEGKASGDKFEINVKPEKGYGTRNESLVVEVPRTAFGKNDVQKGMQFQTEKGDVVTVTDVGKEKVTVDANHPLAGEDLNFSVEVMEVRDATPTELEHGHVHGPGDHH